MATKNRGGRPPKPANERTEQFSIRLTPPMKFAAERIAAWRETSLSQALEFALAVALRNLKIGDVELAELLQIAHYNEDPNERLLLMLPELLNREEREFVRVVNEINGRVKKLRNFTPIQGGAPIDQQRLESIRFEVGRAYGMGLPMDEIIDRWVKTFTPPKK